MRWFVHLLSYVLIILAVIILGFDVWGLSGNGGFQMIDVGRLWFELSPQTLQQAEPAIARYVHPFLWHPVITTILLWPAALVFAIPGVVLWLLSRRRKSHIFFN